MSLDGQRCYLDANAFIYYAELHPVLGAPVQAILERSVAGKLTVVTSELTLAEVLVLPFKLDEKAQIAGYEQLLQDRTGFELIPVSRKILLESAKLRAATGCKLPDAIHVATAQSANCTCLVTEDQRMRATGSMHVVRISELAQQP